MQLAYQAENEEIGELGIEEVKDVREFIREVPLFQGMLQAEEVEGEWGLIEGTCHRQMVCAFSNQITLVGCTDACIFVCVVTGAADNLNSTVQMPLQLWKQNSSLQATQLGRTSFKREMQLLLCT